jgi:hypothetical protein
MLKIVSVFMEPKVLILCSRQLAIGSDPTPLETLHTSMLYRVLLNVMQKNLSKSQIFVTFRNKLVIS